jgi:hypothetical protein
MRLLNPIFGSSKRGDPLERELLTYAAGKGSLERVHEALLGSQVFVLLEGAPNESPDVAPLHPLAVSTPEGYAVVCAFTSPECAVALQRSRPECLAAMPVDFSWLLSTLPTDQGVALNPGEPGCLFLAPDSVGRLRVEMRQAA